MLENIKFLNVNPSDKQTLESKIVQVIKSKKKISYRDTFLSKND